METVEQGRGPHFPGAADEGLGRGNSFQRTWFPKGDPQAPAGRTGYSPETAQLLIAWFVAERATECAAWLEDKGYTFDGACRTWVDRHLRPLLAMVPFAAEIKVAYHPFTEPRRIGGQSDHEARLPQTD